MVWCAWGQQIIFHHDSQIIQCISLLCFFNMVVGFLFRSRIFGFCVWTSSRVVGHKAWNWYKLGFRSLCMCLYMRNGVTNSSFIRCSLQECRRRGGIKSHSVYRRHVCPPCECVMNCIQAIVYNFVCCKSEIIIWINRPMQIGASQRAKTLSRVNSTQIILHNKWVFAYLQCTISVIRLDTDGGTPFEATRKRKYNCNYDYTHIYGFAMARHGLAEKWNI